MDMTVSCTFTYEQHVKHRLNEFEGYVVGIALRPTSTEYEVLPLTDGNASWRDAVWINERFLEAVQGGRMEGK